MDVDTVYSHQAHRYTEVTVVQAVRQCAGSWEAAQATRDKEYILSATEVPLGRKDAHQGPRLPTTVR